MINMVKFYFVHNSWVCPKPYHLLVPDSDLFDQMQLGTTWRYAGRTLYGTRWQSIVIADRVQADWKPRFSHLENNQIRKKSLNRYGIKSWQTFCLKHSMSYLVLRRG